MHLIGIPLRKPSSTEITAATVLAVGLWVLGVGLAQDLKLELTRLDAGALLLVALWGSLSARLGIRIDQGGRHLLASLAGCSLLLGAYQVLATLFG